MKYQVMKDDGTMIDFSSKEEMRSYIEKQMKICTSLLGSIKPKSYPLKSRKHK